MVGEEEIYVIWEPANTKIYHYILSIHKYGLPKTIIIIRSIRAISESLNDVKILPL